MKTINVPLKLQLGGSQDCGPVCVQMVLEYLGIYREIDPLREKLLYAKSGTTVYDNGALFLDEGLKVIAITAQPRLFPPDIISAVSSKEDLVRVIKSKKKYIQNPEDINNLGTFEKFLQKGGEVKLEIPSFKHIKEALDKGNPVVALLFGQALGSKEGGYHFVIVSGYSKTRVQITNPLMTSSQQAWFPIEQFLYAVHVPTTVELDNGTLLVIS